MLEFFSSSAIIFEIIFLFCVGAIGSLFYGKDDEFANWWGNIFAGLGSLLGIIFSTGVLLRGQELNFNFKSYFPLLSFSVHVDYLAAFFVLIISLIALPCSIYSVGYVKYFYQKYNIGVLGFFYNIFLASMILVAIVSNIIFFIIVWELMTMASYFLVIFENREKNNIKAGLLYFIMTHIGTAFIMLLFLFLYKTTGSLEFSAIKDGMINTPNQIKSIILILALIGFGTKSGIIPFHIWLPSAHPAAPSHVSALMSGVMIKMGIYMIIRISFDILSNVPLWFGLLVLIAGAISAILGVLYALNEHDLKRLLAYHSIENIGIILLGLGSSLVFLSMNMPALATIGLIAALYHTINHAVFKSLLFLGAGVVVSATHTRNIEKYGGLIKYMPQTALFFLVGSMAISALPPFNGFVSEWMIFQSLFNGVSSFSAVTKIIFVLSVGVLACTSALAVACFVKAFGMVFLARPRSEYIGVIHEANFLSRAGMGILTTFIIILGFFAGVISRFLLKISNSLINLKNIESSALMNFNFIKMHNEFASISTPIILIAIVLLLFIVIFFVYTLSRKQKVVTNITWDCGCSLEPGMEITATGFSRSIVSVFKNILRPSRKVNTDFFDADNGYFPKNNKIDLAIKDVYGFYFYKPIQKIIIYISNKIKKIQTGVINIYILYIFIALIGLLIIFV